jgi:hypothetical protein
MLSVAMLSVVSPIRLTVCPGKPIQPNLILNQDPTLKGALL